MDTNAAWVALLERRASTQPPPPPPPPPSAAFPQQHFYPQAHNYHHQQYQQQQPHYQYQQQHFSYPPHVYQQPSLPTYHQQPQFQFQFQHQQQPQHQQQSPQQLSHYQPQQQQQQQQQPLPHSKQPKQQQPQKSSRGQANARALGGGTEKTQVAQPQPPQPQHELQQPILPEAESSETASWYCEHCDKEFTQLTAYSAHVATHEKCHHPGCAFSGTKKVVSAHFLSAHGIFSGTGFTTIEVEGQKFRVLMGTSPDEVQQWRADRRKQFPTTANVHAKAEHRDELRAAGGIADKPKRGGGATGGGGGGSGGAKRKRSVSGAGSSAAADATANTNASATNKNRQHLPHPLAGGKHGSLMRKLLEEEVTVEENVVLQIFRFLARTGC